MLPGGCRNNNLGMEVPLNQEFKLKEGAQVHLTQENLIVKFMGEVKDNRCTGVCAWEGNADVSVQIIGNNETIENLVLNTTDQRGYSTTKDFGKYKIQMIRLEREGYLLPSYVLTLRVAK